MKKFMQILLATFGVLALAFAGCAATDMADEEAMEDGEEVVAEEEAAAVEEEAVVEEEAAVEEEAEEVTE